MLSSPIECRAETAITVAGVSKKFKLFASNRERVIEAFHPLRKRLHREFWAVKNVSFEVYRGEIVGHSRKRRAMNR